MKIADTSFKYAGQKGEQLILQMKKIVNNSLEDGIKWKNVYNSAKLSQCFNVKDPVPQKDKSDLVYKCYINVHVLKFILMNGT